MLETLDRMMQSIKDNAVYVDYASLQQEQEQDAPRGSGPTVRTGKEKARTPTSSDPIATYESSPGAPVPNPIIRLRDDMDRRIKFVFLSSGSDDYWDESESDVYAYASGGTSTSTLIRPVSSFFDPGEEEASSGASFSSTAPDTATATPSTPGSSRPYRSYNPGHESRSRSGSSKDKEINRGKDKESLRPSRRPAIFIDPSPFCMVENTILGRADLCFRRLRLNTAYVLGRNGRLVGVVTYSRLCAYSADRARSGGSGSGGGMGSMKFIQSLFSFSASAAKDAFVTFCNCNWYWCPRVGWGRASYGLHGHGRGGYESVREEEEEKEGSVML